MAKRLVRLLRRAPIFGPRFVRAELERRYLSIFGCLPSVDAPSGFNDWMLRRILYDRDPRLRTICDKLAMRDFVRERAGPDSVVPLLGIWTGPASIRWDSLPRRFVLKPNHSSGPIAIVRTEADRDPAALSAMAAKWLRHDFFDVNLEWGYRNLPRRLLAEPLLAGADGGPPVEAQVLTFQGKAALIRVIRGDKETPGRRENWFDVEGRALPVRTRIAVGDYVLCANDARSVVALAERVAAGFSHLRVDCYITGDRPKIGELSAYMTGGRVQWKPPEWDKKLGRLWQGGAPTA